jgi:leader peptidase (prepilin peptidase)/N-methyltransferase
MDWPGVPAWLAPCALAPFIGSFLGVLVLRLPEGKGVAWSRSRCARCGVALRPAELVPLLSYLALRGRCGACGGRIGRFHPAIEAAALAVAAMASLVFAEAAWIWVSCALGWTLLALAWIDARSFLLPDALTLPLLAGGLAMVAWTDPAALGLHALAALVGYAAFRALAWAYARLRGREGLGGGDAKLLAAGGAWLGPAALPAVVVLAALAGIAAAGALALAGRRMDAGTALPFGPALAGAIWLIWLFPDLSRLIG